MVHVRSEKELKTIPCQVQCGDCSVEIFLKDVPLECPFCKSINLEVEKP